MTLVLNNTKSIFKSYMNDWLKKEMIAVDMTVGNGYDSEFLLHHNIQKLYGFDIQKEAVENTKRRLREAGFSNFELFLSNHKDIDGFIQEKADLFVYNLGYLPKGDKSISTNGEDVIESLKKALKLLKINGMIWITFYPGHEEGKKEAEQIMNFLTELEQKEYHVLKMDYINQINNPPFMIALEKRIE